MTQQRRQTDFSRSELNIQSVETVRLNQSRFYHAVRRSCATKTQRQNIEQHGHGKLARQWCAFTQQIKSFNLVECIANPMIQFHHAHV